MPNELETLQKLEEMTPMEIANNYTKLMQLRDEVEARYKIFRIALLDSMKKHNAISIKLDQCTITRTKRKTFKVTNDEVLKKELEARDIPVVLKTILDPEYMKPTFDQLKEDGEILSGCEISEIEYVSVRSSSKK